MAQKARFVAWSADSKRLLPRDLPVGAVYINTSGEEVEVADGYDRDKLTKRKQYILRAGPGGCKIGMPLVLSTEASCLVKSILHWPDNAGPRPDTEQKATWDYIIDKAPSPDAQALYLWDGSGLALTGVVRCLSRMPGGPARFLGWLVID